MIKDLYDFFSHLFDTQGWVARWVCGRWTPALGWTYIVSSLLIGTAYFAIPITLFSFIRRRKDILPFNKVFWLFILFIFSCGVTHFTDAAMFWYPAYRFSATVLFITALVSWVAVILLFKVIPVALSLKSPAQLEKIIKERTDELAKKNLELELLNTKLFEANIKTESLMHQKDEFLSIASHELKTPVTSMKINLQMAEDFTKDDVHYQIVYPFVAKANKQINRLTTLIEELLDITKIQAGKLQLTITRFSVKQALNEWIEQGSSYAIKHKILVHSAEDLMIEADKNRLEQVVVNLLSNAIKYSPDADKVILSLQKVNDCLKVSVTDFGIGIPADKIPFVFDRFFRAKEVHSFSGLGLGLYISYELIKRHGGEMGVTSKENEGSCFWFTVPLIQYTSVASSTENSTTNSVQRTANA